MLLEEFDVDKYERTIREEGTERAFELTLKLLEANRMEDLRRVTEEPEYRELLFREFGL